MSSETGRPQGRDAVREALLDAATDLFADRGHRAVSVRDIARRAGVNHGLVHRHFGSKAALRRQVLERLVDRVDAGVPGADEASLQELLALALERTRTNGAFYKIVARAMLDGEDPRAIQSRFPVAKRLIEAAEREGIENPREWVARQQATGLGWLVFEPWIRASTGLGDP